MRQLGLEEFEVFTAVSMKTEIFNKGIIYYEIHKFTYNLL